MASLDKDIKSKQGVQTDIAEMEEDKISTSDRVSFKPSNYHVVIPISMLYFHFRLGLISCVCVWTSMDYTITFTTH